ncbi:hypothetical protein [Plasmodium yoelii yoelii]|uniref:Uncharacterized protein n=1 Tax=Plasmodium yoelii yoelii TaxID=73239 RepID=Q7R9E8_PLAYO|nr:hypothetical protein [Plasmodium yoelii yoelii]
MAQNTNSPKRNSKPKSEPSV